MTDYTGVWAKLERAAEHLDAFEATLNAYGKSKPIALVSKPNGDGSSDDIFLSLKPLPRALNLCFGDAIHNLRSTLDHLAMALAIDNGADPYDTSIGFPICSGPDWFEGRPDPRGRRRPPKPVKGTGRYQVRALRPEAQAFIEGLQPYPGRTETSCLATLQYLDNMDKHRSLIVQRVYPGAFFSPPEGVVIDYPSDGVMWFEDGAHLATVKYPDGYQGAKVKPQFVASIYVERENRVSIVEATFARNEVLRLIRDAIVGEAERRWP